MTDETAALRTYCRSCGTEIEWPGRAIVMHRPGRPMEYYHLGCDLPPGYAVVESRDGECALGPEKTDK